VQSTDIGVIPVKARTQLGRGLKVSQKVPNIILWIRHEIPPEWTNLYCTCRAYKRIATIISAILLQYNPSAPAISISKHYELGILVTD